MQQKNEHAKAVTVEPKASSHWSCWPDPKGLDDTELLALIDEMTRTLLGFLEPDDADILSRADLQGQTIARIAYETGRPEAEVAKRLRAARQSLCRFVVLTLAPAGRAC